MFKYLSSSFLLVVLCGGSVIQVPPRVEILTIDYEPLKDFWTTWGPGIMEFVELVDLERIMGILVQYLNDPEVMNFVNFIIGSEFRNVVMEFESLAEFKEVRLFLLHDVVLQVDSQIVCSCIIYECGRQA